MGGILKIIGIDILPQHSPSSHAQPHYAVAILVDGKIVSKYTDVSLARLLRLIDEEEPDYVAIDNILELGEDVNSVVNIIRNFPPKTKLVQVTKLEGNREYPLSFLARLNGLSVGDKLTPLQAAEISALLASKGIGSMVKIYDEKTMILVSRARTLKAGGMSRERYLRHIHTLILRITRKVKESLDKAGLDYDYFYRKTVTGLEGSVFIVYAERRKLFGIVRPMKGHDVNVIIKPIERQKVNFIPLKGHEEQFKLSPRYIIIGLDPGIVTGMAILDIEGRPLLTLSKRYLSRGDIISIAYEYGTPILIATDVPRPPSMVKKLASTLKAPLYTPPRTLSVVEKEELVHEYLERFRNDVFEKIEVVNSHQRDALASAIKAYLNFKPKFEQAEAKIRELGVSIPLREVKALIIRGKSIMDAINDVKKKYSQKDSRSTVERIAYVTDPQLIEQLRTQIKKQNELIDKLIEERSYLYEQINKLKKRVHQLEELLNEITNEQALKLKENKLIATMSRRIEELQYSLSQLKEERNNLLNDLNEIKKNLRLMLLKKQAPIKYVRALTIDSLNESTEKWNISKGDLLLVLDISLASEDALQRLKSIGIKAILTTTYPPDHVNELALEYEIPIITISERRVKWILGIPFITNLSELNKSIKEIRKDLKKKARLRSLQDLKRIVNEYRSMRFSS